MSYSESKRCLEHTDSDLEAGVGHGRLSPVLSSCDADECLRDPAKPFLPSRAAIAQIIDDLKAIWYPSHFGSVEVGSPGVERDAGGRLERVQASLLEQTRRGLQINCKHWARNDSSDACVACTRRACEVVKRVVARLPALRERLNGDVQAAFDGDPSAKSIHEVLCCYPGVSAILQYRVAHELHALSVPLLPRMISELARSSTGIDIHPGATIESNFFIDHGTGVVIGETARIGKRVRLYQGVTLGARIFPKDARGQLIKGLMRHPIVEDDVTIYAGATILGRVTIGQGSVIAGNVWLTRSVPEGSRITRLDAGSRELFENGSGI